MGQVRDATRIGPDALVEIEGPPEIHRRQAFAKPGLWAGITTTEPGLVSGWHHHGGHDTIVYVISGHLAIEFGEGLSPGRPGSRRRLPRDPQRSRPPGEHPRRSAIRKRRDPRRRRRPTEDRGRGAVVVLTSTPVRSHFRPGVKDEARPAFHLTASESRGSSTTTAVSDGRRSA